MGQLATDAAIAIPLAIYLLSLWALYIRVQDTLSHWVGVPAVSALVLAASLSGAPVLVIGLLLVAMIIVKVVEGFGKEKRITMTLKEAKTSVKARLAAAWTALLVLYIYADFLSLYRPGQLKEIGEGAMGPFGVSQGTLLIASVIVIIPAVMVVLSLLLFAGVNRPLNLVLAVLYTLVNISNLIGESWAYYLLFGIIEIAVTAFIFFTAWRWPTRVG